MKISLIILVLAASMSFASPLPPSLFFVANEGQWEGAFAFRCDVGNASYFVTPSGMTIDLRSYLPPLAGGQRGAYSTIRGHGRPCPYEDVAGHVETRAAESSVRGHVLKMSFVNANPNPEIIGEEKLASYSNYFLGRDSCKWRSRVGHYAKVIAKNVWAGIDVEYQVQDEGVETIYHVKPGADLSQIVIQYEGQDSPITVDANGCLLLQTSLGVIKEKAPFAYQIVNGRQIEVPTRYELVDNDRYAIRCDGVDANRELVIDPLLYSTFFGYGDGIYDMTRSASGNLVVTGSTMSVSFPITPGAYQDQMIGFSDAYLSALTPDGRELVFSTFIGGSTNNMDASVRVRGDASNALYIGGITYSSDWPLTSNAFQTVYNGAGAAFLTRFSPDGSSLEFSSYVEGSGTTVLEDMAIDTSTQELYLVGGLASHGVGFPLTADCMYSQSVGGPSFVSIFDPSISRLPYSTLIPALAETTSVWANSVFVVGHREVWLAGSSLGGGAVQTTTDGFQPRFMGGHSDGFLLQVDFTSRTLTYGSYLGGSEDDYINDWIPGVGRVTITGVTTSVDFPTTPGAYQPSLTEHVSNTFVSILSIPGSLLHSTFVSSDSGWSSPDGLGMNSDGDVTVVCFTGELGFPTTPNGISPTPVGQYDVGICRFSPDLSMVRYGTYFGGTGEEHLYSCMFEGGDSLWVGGLTFSSDYPITDDAYSHEGSQFLSQIVAGPNSAVGRRVVPVPTSMNLSCYPNPFNSTTTLAFTLPTSSRVTLDVYNVLGRVAFSTNMGRMSAGEHQYVLDGSGMASGVYFAALRAGKETVVKKVALLK